LFRRTFRVFLRRLRKLLRVDGTADPLPKDLSWWRGLNEALKKAKSESDLKESVSQSLTQPKNAWPGRQVLSWWLTCHNSAII